jgi:hypothetical protein
MGKGTPLPNKKTVRDSVEKISWGTKAKRIRRMILGHAWTDPPTRASKRGMSIGDIAGSVMKGKRVYDIMRMTSIFCMTFGGKMSVPNPILTSLSITTQ